MTDDNKSIRTISNFAHLIQLHLIWQILAKFSLGTHLSLSKFRKRKRQFLWLCQLAAQSIKRAREIKKFHVVVVQRRQRHVQNNVMHVQSCCLLI